MPIYWSILGVTAFLGVLSYYFPRPQSKLNTDSGQSTRLFSPFLYSAILSWSAACAVILPTPPYMLIISTEEPECSAILTWNKRVGAFGFYQMFLKR